MRRNLPAAPPPIAARLRLRQKVSPDQVSIVNSGRITAHKTGIVLSGASIFAGGILNKGTITTVHSGISFDSLWTFVGGITNRGRIAAGQSGIDFSDMSTFAGGIVNSGTISAISYGINFARVSTFAGGVANNGTIISKSLASIEIFSDRTFGGAITSSGTIVAKSIAGIQAFNVLTFGGGITNSGTISAASRGMLVGAGTFLAPGVPSFSGDVVNTGKISAKTGISIAKSTITGAIVGSGTINATSRGILIDNSNAFTGTVSGFGGVNHGNRVQFIDLASVTSAAHTISFGYAPAGGSGTLTVSSGAALICQTSLSARRQRWPTRRTLPAPAAR